MIDRDRTPQLSVVVVTHALSGDLLTLMSQLRAQSRAKKLELVIVTSSSRILSLDPALREAFLSLQIVEMPNLRSIGKGKAAGVEAARAPLVVFTENHCRLTPDWAKALIEAHGRGEFAAVGPLVLNANPENAVSWGGFLVFYGPWMGHLSAKNMRHLPGNQSCYRREILMDYGQDLADILEAESLLHWDLAEKGYRLRLDPKVSVSHINPTRLYSLVEEHYLASRIFAYLRTRRQSAFKRFVYTIGSPLIPLIRLRRICREIREARLDAGILWSALMPIIINLCAGAAGEMAGYALGVGKTRQRLVLFEAVRDAA